MIRCKHYTGIQNKTCQAGVCYDDLKGGLLPCIRPKNNGECGKYELPTAEELAAEEAAFQASSDRMKKLTPLIIRIKKEQKGKSWRGVEVCPACGGRLHLMHAACNGHMRGKCETTDCVWWVE